MNQEIQERFLRARYELIARDYNHLNNMQQKAVLKTEGPLLVLAGAGSGKTTVLVHRILHLVQYGSGAESASIPDYVTPELVDCMESAILNHRSVSQEIKALCAIDPCPPWRIIAITFTNKAAGELKARLERVVGSQAREIWAMTFHSACCRILRRDGSRIGYSSDFTIYDSADSQSLIKSILVDMGKDPKTFAPKTILSYISRAKDGGIYPKEYSEQAKQSSDYMKKVVSDVYKQYSDKMKAANAMDFDDIIMLTVKMLETNPDLLDEWQSRFRYVMVDEFQDTNQMQNRLVTLLAGKHHNLCVVGDDDQSIYRFRGATVENILSFENIWRNAEVIRLEQNYRSTHFILDAANAVISHNVGRKGKNLWTEKQDGNPVEIHECQTERDEAEWISAKIMREREKGRKFSDFAVLYRTNAQANALETRFRESGTPYRIIGGTRFYDRAEIKDILAYLFVIQNQNDDLRLKRIINVPPRGIGQKSIETVQSLAEKNRCSLFDIVSHADLYPELCKSKNKLFEFSELIKRLTEHSRSLNLEDFYDSLLADTGYEDMLRTKKEDAAGARLDNILEFKSSIINYIQNAENFDLMPSLSGFLEEVSLFTDIEQYDPSADAVVLMTIHSAKGLEFPSVFLTGLEYNLFPSVQSQSEENGIEEERRLCYVAMTRAKEQLTITYARYRMLYGRTSLGGASRFVNEIPLNCIRQSETLQENRSISNNMYSPRERGSIGREAGNECDLTRCMQLKSGDQVIHKTFGRGTVLSAAPVGGDLLLEIYFETNGKKMLMAKTAGRFITIL